VANVTKKERIQAALAGKQVDRPPVALWRHWPIDDQDAELLAERALDFQQRYDWDFIKIPPSSTYCIDDYEAKNDYKALPTGRWFLGERTYKERVVKQINDWDRIEPLDVYKGTYGRILQCLKGSPRLWLTTFKRRFIMRLIWEDCLNSLGISMLIGFGVALKLVLLPS